MAKCVKCKSAPIPAEQSDSCYKCLCRQQAEQIEALEKEVSAYHNYLANNGYGVQLHDIKKNIEAAQPQKESKE